LFTGKLYLREHHEKTGQVERSNRVSLSILTKLSIEKPFLWYKYVRKVQSHWKNAKFEIMFGTRLWHTENLSLLQLLKQELLDCFMNNRDDVRVAARTQIRRIQAKNTHHYNLCQKEARKYARWIGSYPKNTILPGV